MSLILHVIVSVLYSIISCILFSTCLALFLYVVKHFNKLTELNFHSFSFTNGIHRRIGAVPGALP